MDTLCYAAFLEVGWRAPRCWFGKEHVCSHFVYWDPIWATMWVFPGSSSRCVAISAWQCPSVGLGRVGCCRPSDTVHPSCCRYFQCPPKFGLFAPIHKVIRIGFPSTSPAKAKKSKRMAMGVSALTHSPSSSSISSVSSVASSVGGRPSRSGLVSGFFHSPSAAGTRLYEVGGLEFSFSSCTGAAAPSLSMR